MVSHADVQFARSRRAWRQGGRPRATADGPARSTARHDDAIAASGQLRARIQQLRDLEFCVAAGNRAAVAEKQGRYTVEIDPKNLWKSIELLEKQMFQAAKDLEFEVAAKLRDQIEKLKMKAL